MASRPEQCGSSIAFPRHHFARPKGLPAWFGGPLNRPSVLLRLRVFARRRTLDVQLARANQPKEATWPHHRPHTISTFRSTATTARSRRTFSACSSTSSTSLIGKQAHWNVEGRHFRSVHLFLDELVESWLGFADQVAERAVALGASPDGQAETVVGSSKMDALPAGALSDVAVKDAIAAGSPAWSRARGSGSPELPSSTRSPRTCSSPWPPRSRSRSGWSAPSDRAPDHDEPEARGKRDEDRGRLRRVRRRTRGLKRAAELADGHAELVVVAAAEPRAGAGITEGAHLDPSEIARRRKDLEEAKALLADRAIEAETIEAQGDPGDVVIEAANDADLIVVGSRGLNPLQRLLL